MPMFPEDAGTKEFYRERFDQFDNGGGTIRPSWCWPAFLFPGVWYMVKGMWVKAAAMWIILSWMGYDSYEDLIIFGSLIALYSGLFGRFDYYLWSRYGKQLT